MAKLDSAVYKYVFFFVLFLGGLYLVFPDHVDNYVIDTFPALFPYVAKEKPKSEEPGIGENYTDDTEKGKQAVKQIREEVEIAQDDELMDLLDPDRPKVSADKIPECIRQLINEDFDVPLIAREKAIEDLGNTGVDGVEPIVPLMNHEDIFVQRGAAFALGNIGPAAEKALGNIISKAEHKDSLVRNNIIRALGLIKKGPEQTMPVLINALSDKEDDVRKSAILALSRTGVEAIPYLIDVLEDKDRGVLRIDILYALGGMRSKAKSAATVVSELRFDFDSDIRKAAELAYGQINPEQ